MRRADVLITAGDFALIETMRWQGEIHLLNLHLQRMGDSAVSLGFRFDERETRSRLVDACRQLPADAPHRIRLTLGRDGDVVVEASPVERPVRDVLLLGIADDRLDSSDVLLRHKTSRRHLQERAYSRAVEAGLDEVLFFNERDEVCEGTRTNIVVVRHGRRFTPHADCGLLPGIYRQHLMQRYPDMEETVLHMEDLVRADSIHLCNAVWGRRAAALAAGVGRSAV